MVRFPTATLVTFCFALSALGAASASASSGGVHYRADPASPPAAEKVVARDVVWRCGANGCVAGQSNSRAAIECAALARQVGTLRSFTAGGRPLAPEALEKCNARAR